MNKFLCLFAFAFLFSQNIFSQTINLEDEEPTWQTVLSGNPISRPLKTTYGFVVVTDGHQIVACSDSGTLLWQQRVKGFPTPHYTVARGDFLYVVTSENKLNLINPSGVTLWSEYVPFDEIIVEPTAGKDGRMYVQGKSEIACYSLSGILKWTLDVGEMDEKPLFTMNDGSVVALMKKNENGKSTGIRLSPFGEKIEEITFGGKIEATAECDEGLFIVFSDGSVGLCKIRDNNAKSAWLLLSNETGLPSISSQNIAIRAIGNTVILATKNGAQTKIVGFDAKTHKITSTFDIPEVQVSSSGFFETDGESVTIADNAKAASYTLSGEYIWAVQLPSAKSWQFAFLLDDGQLAFTTNSWVAKSFRVFQKPRDKKTSAQNTKKQKQSVYEDFFQSPQSINGYSVKALDKNDYAKLAKTLSEGNYSTLEKEWIPIIKKEASDMADFYASGNGSASRDLTSKFRSDIVYQQQICNLMALFGSSIFSDEIALLLHTVTDSQMLVFLLKTVEKIGYDEDGALLREIEFIESRRALKDDTVLLKSCADAAYSVCRVMGRPALYARGKAILAYMLNPQYDKKIREYARQKLKDIIALGI